MARRSRIEDRALELFTAAPLGLSVDDVIQRLTHDGPAVSPRGVRALLNTMSASGQLVRQRRPPTGPGAPPFLYFHPLHAPPDPSALDRALDSVFAGASAEVSTRDQLDEAQVSPGAAQRHEHGSSVLLRIAQGMVHEDHHAAAILANASRLAALKPIALLLDMAEWVADDLNTLARQRADQQANGEHRAAESTAAELDTRLAWARRYFHALWRLDRGVPGSPAIFEIPRSAWHVQHDGGQARIDRARAEQRLAPRLLGHQVAELMDVDPDAHSVAAGTDASIADIRIERGPSTYGTATTMAVMTAAAALVHRGDRVTREFQDFDIFPDQLQQLDDHAAAAKGFVLAPHLTDHHVQERDARHTRMAALELRQYDEELRIVLRNAKWRPLGTVPSMLLDPRPTVLFRDGRVFPLVHRLRDYEASGLYGQIVRNQIERFSQVLHHAFSGPSGDVVYGAVVKTPETSWLAPLIFWDLHRSKTSYNGRVVIQKSEQVYRAPFADSTVAQLLFLGLSPRGSVDSSALKRRAFRTCVAIRRFADIAFDDESLPVMIDGTDGRRAVDEDAEHDWHTFLRARAQRKLERDNETLLPLPLYKPFVYLCTSAGVAMAYGAPAELYLSTGSARALDSAPFVLPRLEAAVNMRDTARAVEFLGGMLGWMAAGGRELSRYHRSGEGGSTDRAGLPVLVPDVIALAHDAATFARRALGDEVEDRVRQLVASLRAQVASHAERSRRPYTPNES